MAAARQYAEGFPQHLPPHDFVQTSTVDGYSEIWVEVTEPKNFPLPSQKLKRKVTVTLDRKKWTITGSCSHGHASTKVAIGVGDDQRACFMLDGNAINVERATEIILSPALYPDLASNDSSPR